MVIRKCEHKQNVGEFDQEQSLDVTVAVFFESGEQEYCGQNNLINMLSIIYSQIMQKYIQFFTNVNMYFITNPNHWL